MFNEQWEFTQYYLQKKFIVFDILDIGLSIELTTGVLELSYF